MAQPLSDDLVLALDPCEIMRRAGMEPDPWQQRILSGDWQRLAVLNHRQAGKSTATAALALHEAFYRPVAPIPILCPSERQSKELLRKVREFYNALGRPVAAVKESTVELEFANGGRILALPGTEKTVRSLSGVRLLIADEASRVADELYQAVRPMLAVSGGRILALTTPAGRRGWFFREWTEGVGWERIRVTADDCPRISKAFLEEERMSLGEWAYRQEYLCDFTDTEEALFPEELVSSAFSDNVPSLFGGTQ